MTKLPKIERCVCGSKADWFNGVLTCLDDDCGWQLWRSPYDPKDAAREWGRVMRAAKAAKKAKVSRAK